MGYKYIIGVNIQKKHYISFNKNRTEHNAMDSRYPLPSKLALSYSYKYLLNGIKSIADGFIFYIANFNFFNMNEILLK